MEIIKTYDEFINESIWSDIRDRANGESTKKEDIINSVDELKDIIIDRINETTGNVLDLSDIGNRISKLDTLKDLFDQSEHNVKLPDTITEIDVTGWDTSNVTDISSLFYKCENLEKITGLETWDVSNVKHMMSMFYYCKNLKELNIGNWDVSGVTNMGSMFSGCKSLTELNIGNWDVSGVKYMMDIFYPCEKLKQLPSWYRRSGWYRYRRK